MNSVTRHRLNDLNRQFYSERAGEFDATRKHDWPGWQKTVDLLQPQPEGRATRILDIGCGNGRFAHFLLGEHPIGTVDYTGVDQSRELLAVAESECVGGEGDSLRWQTLDLTSDEIGGAILPDRFQLIVAFGLLHHIPSQEYRRRLISFMADRLVEGGILVFTVWRFDQSERFRSKIISWQDYNRTAVERIDLQELEDGDYLMSFGDTRRSARYCHAPDEAEISDLTASLGLERIARFLEDGKTHDLNEYHVFMKTEKDLD